MSDQTRTIIANVDRLNRFMDLAGCSALILRSGKNFTYLAGFSYPRTLGRHLDFPDSPREVLLVWPRRGEPVMVLNHYAAPLALRDSWLEKIVVYDDYAESPYQKAAEILKDLGMDRGVVGLEKTYVSAARWEEMAGLLHGGDLLDCTGMMDQVRWIKTSGEVELLREGRCFSMRLTWKCFPPCGKATPSGRFIAASSPVAYREAPSGPTAS